MHVGRRRRVGVKWLALVAATAGVLATGCGSSGGSRSDPAASSAPPSTAAATSTTLAGWVPTGFAGFTDVADRFSIAVPTTWRQVDPSSPGAAQLLQELSKQNPGLASFFGPGDLAAQGIKFLALAGGTSRASANMEVKPALGGRDSDLPRIGDQVKAEYDKLGATVSNVGSEQLSGRAALTLTVELPLTAATGVKSTVHEVQHLIVANDLIYILTLSGDDAQLATIATTLRVS